MKNIFFKWICVFGLFGILVSCERESNDFKGSDNYIIDFSLSCGGVDYKGSITEDQVVVVVPASVSLEGASARVVISENAEINPNPQSITNWNQEEQFVVTSYNKQRKSYIYRIRRSSVVTSGNVSLLTQQDVDDFVKSGVSVIDGNLTIGKAVGGDAADTISNLKGLANITEVVHNITINNTYSGTDLSGLGNIEKIGGLKIGNIVNLRVVDLPKLKNVGTAISVASAGVKEARMPELQFVGESFTIKSDSLVVADFAELGRVGADLVFNGTNGSAQHNLMETISFPKLESVGGAFTMNNWVKAVKMDFPMLKSVGGILAMSYWNKMDIIDLPVLEAAGGVNFANMNSIEDIKMPLLKAVNGNVTFSLASIGILKMKEIEQISGTLTLSVPKAVQADFSELREIGVSLAISSSSAKLAMPYFPKLKKIGKNCEIETAALKELSGFESLEEIGGRLYLKNSKDLKSIDGMKSLKKIGTQLYLYDLKLLTLLNISKLEVAEIDIYLSTWEGLTIKGDGEYNGYLLLGSPSNTVIEMVKFDGIKRVRRLSVSSSSFKGDVVLGGIEEVTELLDFSSSNNCPVISMPDLKRAGGIKFNYNNSLQMADFPSLEQITGTPDNIGFSYPVTSNIEQINLPLLKSVVGNISVTNMRSGAKLEELNIPLIESISADLTISGSSNTSFKSVQNFSNLKSVSKITISNCKSLADFTGFKQAVVGLSDQTWTVSGCAYNPTFENMQNGEYK